MRVTFDADMGYAALTNDKGTPRREGGSQATMIDRIVGRRKRPPRISARGSILKPHEFEQALKHFDVSKRRHAAHIGKHEDTVEHWCRGIGVIPITSEWVFMLYHTQNWTRRIRCRFTLPLREWGIDREDTGEDSTHSILSPAEYAQALKHFDVSKRLHASHTGRNQVTVIRWTHGVGGWPVPLVDEWVLMAYHYLPKTRNLRGRIALPLRQWGIERDDADGQPSGDDTLYGATPANPFGDHPDQQNLS